MERSTDVDRVLADVAAAQHGVITRAQAAEAGLSDRAIGRRLERRWHSVLPGVYVVAGVPEDRALRHWAAVLHAGPGCPLALHTAGRLHGLAEAFDLDEVALLVGGERGRPPAGVVWRHQVDLHESDVVWIDGLPVTSIPRTAMDLASDPRVSITRLRRIVESGIVAHRLGAAGFGIVADRVRRSGKTGVSKMSQVLDDLGPGVAIARSRLEGLRDPAILEAGLPPPVHEHPLPGARDRAGFVDRCWPEARLVVEADGRKWHSRREQMTIDHDRVLQSQVVGYQTSRLMWELLAGDRPAAGELLGQIHAQRLRETAASR